MKQSQDRKTAIHKNVLMMNSSMCPEFVWFMDGVPTKLNYRPLAVKPMCAIPSWSQVCSIYAQNLTPSIHSCPSWVSTWGGHTVPPPWAGLHYPQVHKCFRCCRPSPKQRGRQWAPTLLDIPIPPPLAPGPLPTRREMTQMTVILGGSLQKGLQLIYPMDPVRIMHYFSEILTTCPSNFASIKMLAKPEVPCELPDSTKSYFTFVEGQIVYFKPHWPW